MSIFEEYYKEQPFIDRYLDDPDKGIDVIIPVYHTNELWRANLFSIFREIPVSRLLISDGGCIDDSIDVVEKFPRVTVLNHRHLKTLGKCIAGLIEEVSSEWFIYLHSDVYLPPGWFDNMIRHQGNYDWYGCPMQITVMVTYRPDGSERPYAGSQMGRKKAFSGNLHKIDDDYVYRQEDFVFNKIVEDAGYKTGKVEDTFHYHQVMYRTSAGYDLNISQVNVITNTKEKEVLRSLHTQIKGIVKYLPAKEPYVIKDFRDHAFLLLSGNHEGFFTFRKWIRRTNPDWLPYFNYKLLMRVYYHRLKGFLRGYSKP